MRLLNEIKAALADFRAKRASEREQELIDEASYRINIRKIVEDDEIQFAITMDDVPIHVLDDEMEAIDVLDGVRTLYYKTKKRNPLIKVI